jgi:hypothetical protein
MKAANTSKKAVQAGANNIVKEGRKRGTAPMMINALVCVRGRGGRERGEGERESTAEAQSERRSTVQANDEKERRNEDTSS